MEAAEEEPDEYGHLADQMDRSGKSWRRLSPAYGAPAGQATGSEAARFTERAAHWITIFIQNLPSDHGLWQQLDCYVLQCCPAVRLRIVPWNWPALAP